MAIDPKSIEADKLANLYRAAFYIAKGATGLGLELLKKTNQAFPNMNLESEKDRFYWSEKILDRYMLLKIKMSHE